MLAPTARRHFFSKILPTVRSWHSNWEPFRYIDSPEFANPHRRGRSTQRLMKRTRFRSVRTEPVGCIEVFGLPTWFGF